MQVNSTFYSDHTLPDLRSTIKLCPRIVQKYIPGSRAAARRFIDPRFVCRPVRNLVRYGLWQVLLTYVLNKEDTSMGLSDVPGSMEPRSEMNIARTFALGLFTRSAAYYRGYVCLQYQDDHDSNTATSTVRTLGLSWNDPSKLGLAEDSIWVKAELDKSPHQSVRNDKLTHRGSGPSDQSAW